jgi:hypothetical protein
MAKLTATAQSTVLGNMQAHLAAVQTGMKPFAVNREPLDMSGYLAEVEALQNSIRLIEQYRQSGKWPDPELRNLGDRKEYYGVDPTSALEVAKQDIERSIQKIKSGNSPMSDRLLRIGETEINASTASKLKSLGLTDEDLTTLTAKHNSSMQQRIDSVAEQMASEYGGSSEQFENYEDKSIARAIANGNYTPTTSVQDLLKKYQPPTPKKEEEPDVHVKINTERGTITTDEGKEYKYDPNTQDPEQLVSSGQYETLPSPTKQATFSVSDVAGKTSPITLQQDNMAEKYTIIDPSKGTISYPDGTVQKYNAATQDPKQLIAQKNTGQSNSSISSTGTSQTTQTTTPTSNTSQTSNNGGMSASEIAARGPSNAEIAANKTTGAALPDYSSAATTMATSKSATPTLDNQQSLAAAEAVLKKYLDAGIIDQGTYDLFKQSVGMWQPDSEINMENIMKTFSQLKTKTIDPYFKEQTKIFEDSVQRDLGYISQERARELQMEQTNAAENIRGTQAGLEASGMTFSGHAGRLLGSQSAYRTSGSQSGIIPVQKFGTGLVEQQNQLTADSSSARYNKTLQDLSRQAELQLGSAASGGLVPGTSQLGGVTGSQTREYNVAQANLLGGLYSQEQQNAEYRKNPNVIQ